MEKLITVDGGYEVPKASLEAIEQIETEVNELHKQTNSVMLFLEKCERSCRTQQDVILERRWSKAEKQIILRTVKKMKSFANKIEKELR